MHVARDYEHSKSWILQYDKAPARKSLLVSIYRSCSGTSRTRVFPDLAPCDFFYGWRFYLRNNDSRVRSAATKSLERLAKTVKLTNLHLHLYTDDGKRG
ncbi:hypothetical protein AVEN_128455-1 [Araneus ventricosus]|uniref:Uncharacterized protein n=1 Tax=Araneus ventricosus TaxID=182803 RepID=A0A4Y2MZ87_ARAVE|nr:hypothetical protein AVEN_128455-1 [Araneus ventricosus]